jgi:hypothetical protein
VRAFEAPGALGCEGAASVVRRSDPDAGWEYAEAEGRAVGIRRLWGYDGQSASAPWQGYSNLNLAYAYAEQPLVFETQPSAEPRLLAAASLLRPQPFEAAAEFAGIRLSPQGAEAFRVTWPDGDTAWAALGETPPRHVELAGVAAEGEGLRCLRLSRDAQRICGFGLLRLGGIATLEAPGVLELAREADGAVTVKTDVGLSLAEAWLGGAIRRAETLTRAGEWIDVSDRCREASLPGSLVKEWAERNQRNLVEFRLSR